MSWISDVREEIRNLDASKERLRKFGIMVGGVFLLLTVLVVLKKYHPALCYFLGITGILLMIIGASFPHALKEIYKVWMGMAFAIGWVVSRILLMLIFFLVLTPIGLIGRLFGKEFLDIKPKKAQGTYWVRKNREKKVNYEKMY